MKSFIIILVICILMPFISIKAQAPCDFNGNGFIDVADGIRFLDLLLCHPDQDSFPSYSPLYDCDQDSIDLTQSDLFALYRRLIYGGDIQGIHVISSTDTIRIPDAVAAPGEHLNLPISLYSNLAPQGIQFYLRYDPSLIEITGFFRPESLPENHFQPPCFFDSALSSMTDMLLDSALYPDPLIFLSINIRQDISVPNIATIQFDNDPHRAAYTGISLVDPLAVPPDPNVMFISPVMIGSTITILPTGIDENRNTNDDRISLEIYGNPANVTYLIRYYVPNNSHVDLDIYDILGRQVAILFNGNVSQGHHEVSWNASDKASSIYFCRLSTDHEAITKKITLMK
jgi:hypothetical protein